jgi:hypothetical protein
MPEVGQYGPDVWKDARGNRQRSITTTVYETDGTTPATLYSSQAGTDTIANPIPTGVAQGSAGEDTEGNLIFYATPGPYVLVGTRGGSEVWRGPITVNVDSIAGTTRAVAEIDDGDSPYPLVASVTQTVLADASGGPVTVSLPAAGSSGLDVSVKKVDASGNAVTVDGDGAETVDGAATLALSSQYESVRLADGLTGWWIL